MTSLREILKDNNFAEPNQAGPILIVALCALPWLYATVRAFMDLREGRRGWARMGFIVALNCWIWTLRFLAMNLQIALPALLNILIVTFSLFTAFPFVLPAYAVGRTVTDLRERRYGIATLGMVCVGLPTVLYLLLIAVLASGFW